MDTSILIQKVIERNEKFWNPRWLINYELEYKLLVEEARETIMAVTKKDKKEIIDGCIDVMFVAIWTLHKLGLTESQIVSAFNIVCESNMSKLWAWKDERWKVKKWEDFIEPDFTSIIETL